MPDNDPLFLLNESDRAILKQMADEFRNSQSNSPTRPWRSPSDTTSPDQYIALPPAGGIPAIDPLGTGSVGDEDPQEGDKPGTAECEIYHVLPTAKLSSNEFEIKKVNGLSKTVINISRKKIDRDWVPVTRLKDGNWLALSGAQSSPLNSVLYVALPNDSRGIKPLERIVTGTGADLVGDDFPVVGDIPGQGKCRLYRITNNAIEFVDSDIDVFNLFRTPIPREWCVVGQDAQGKWVATHPPHFRRAKAKLLSTIDSGEQAEYLRCGPGTGSNDPEPCVQATLYHFNWFLGQYEVTDETITVCPPDGFEGILFKGDLINIDFDEKELKWYAKTEGAKFFVTSQGLQTRPCPPYAMTVQSPSGANYSIRGDLLFPNGVDYFFGNSKLLFTATWDQINKRWQFEGHDRYSLLVKCAYYVYCSAVWSRKYSVGWHISDPTMPDTLAWAAGEVGETKLYCDCTTTTTSTTTTTTTTVAANCCDQLPTIIYLTLEDFSDCHYNSQVIALVDSGLGHQWNGTLACGDSLSVVLSCNPGGGPTVSALQLSITWNCAGNIRHRLFSVPGGCSCASIASCHFGYVLDNTTDCQCCGDTTTTTTTTTSTTTTTTTTGAGTTTTTSTTTTTTTSDVTVEYSCQENECGTCVRQWSFAFGGGWHVLSSSCVAPCSTCCQPGFNGTIGGQQTIVGCCDNGAKPCV